MHSGVDAMLSIDLKCEGYEITELNKIEDVPAQNLGDEPLGKEPEFSSEVNLQIAEKWIDYLTNGAPRDDKQEVVRKYPIPKNIPSSKATGAKSRAGDSTTSQFQKERSLDFQRSWVWLLLR
nr:unnamed protein product [Callosobruchus analis]